MDTPISVRFYTSDQPIQNVNNIEEDKLSTEETNFNIVFTGNNVFVVVKFDDTAPVSLDEINVPYTNRDIKVTVRYVESKGRNPNFLPVSI